MNLNRLHEIIRETTTQFRNGPEITVNGREFSPPEPRDGATPAEKAEAFEAALMSEARTGGCGLGVIDINVMLHESDLPESMVKVDMILVAVGVVKERADAIRQELADMLEEWAPGLQSGPSFIAWGAQVGDQGAAMQLMALGKVLGFWDVITPKGIDPDCSDAQARYMASAGFLMTTGFKP